MADVKKPEVHISWYNAAVVERFGSVLYPIDILELLRRLTDIAYIVPQMWLTSGEPDRTKPLAYKGDIELIINQDVKTIGVKGRDPQRVTESFQELRDLYMESLDHSPGLSTHYVEFTGQGWVRTGAQPTRSSTAFWADFQRLRDFEKTLGTPVSNFGLQLVPADADPNDPNWFHIIIDPLISASATRYHTRWVWRGSDVGPMLKRFSGMNPLLEKIVSRIEA